MKNYKIKWTPLEFKTDESQFVLQPDIKEVAEEMITSADKELENYEQRLIDKGVVDTEFFIDDLERIYTELFPFFTKVSTVYRIRKHPGIVFAFHRVLKGTFIIDEELYNNYKELNNNYEN